MFIRECFQKQPVSVSFNAWIIMLLKTKNYLFEKHLYLILENLRIENYGVIRQLQNNSNFHWISSSSCWQESLCWNLKL